MPKAVPYLTHSDRMSELLEDATDHVCAMKPEWVMITHKNGAGVAWNNAYGNPQGPPEKFEPMLIGLLYCPFCGLRFGEPNEETEAVTDVLRQALSVCDNVAYDRFSPDELKDVQSAYSGILDERIQITIINQD